MADTRRRTGSDTRALALAGTGVAVAAVLALSGCGSSSDDGSTGSHPPPSSSPSARSGAPASAGSQDGADGSVLQTALTTTSHSESARMVIDETVRTGGRTVTVHGSGVTSLQGAGPGGRGEFTVVTAGGQVEMRVLGTTLYEKLPPSAATRKLTGGKAWIKVDTTRIPHASGSMSNEAPDASAQLGYLAHPQRVTRVGSESVDGVATTHYRVSVSPRVLATSGMDATRPIPVDVWVDAQHHVRQEKLSATMTAAKSTTSAKGSPQGPVSVTMTLHLRDFGTPVHVSAPPSGQVTDATQRIAAAAGSSSATAS